ncbi:MAG: extracellular solute-binding protein [Anaerolineae bacterium]|jgi:multiple sugar transport system substrate-binding protein
MKKKGLILLFGLIVILSSWWFLNGSSRAQPSHGVIDVWATWGDDPAQLQALFDRYSQSSGVPVRVTTRVKSKELLKALAGPEPPDLVVLSSVDLVAVYHQQGLVEPLDGWIQVTGIDLDDVYPAPLAQCQGLDGVTLCLPWGSDVDALFWNKDLFASAGLDPERPPQTMEELVEYAGKLTLRDEQGELTQVGLIPDFPRSHADLYVRMFGGGFYSADGDELAANRQAVIDALAWQRQFYDVYDPAELEEFASSFTPYMTSRHPLYAGRRLSCQHCHRSSPIQNGKTPDTGFFEGKIAMMIDGEWQVSPNALSHEEFRVSYGVAPFPPPATHPDRANTAVVQGPVVIVPASAVDKEAVVQLLAWMMSPEIVAEAAYAHSLLPTSRTAAQDPRFQEIPNLEVFMSLLAHPNAKYIITTPISSDLNETLGQVEAEVLDKRGDPVPLLNEVQVEFAPRLKEALSYHDGP